MKPDWDKLATKFNGKSNALIVDVDCTADTAKELCTTYGVQGYPTIKYFKNGLSKDGVSYEDGRDLKSFNKFVKKMSKPPCDPATLENCDKKDKAYLDEIKDLPADKRKEAQESMQKELGDLEAEHKAAADLFEQQKDVAIATQKKQQELKEVLTKVSGKHSYKLALLKATSVPKEEL
ncbi:unnamed protein product [Polarella glacialis]|uniref:Thioredoxin domain-containing protein n=1 Tax=Polarella glacialis TaxID=89957 RepID=A0A813HFE5_POLGL|nr:unnamed protein product [Polarella glacialis]|mmetsp:Transcript_22943/g.36886  ORF Transcript_22943/g.36886 Transcript_22943/m.36886 type:complete len:178 (-) Transcript_22943:430-963(-)